MRALIYWILLPILVWGTLSAGEEKRDVDPGTADRDLDGVPDRDDRCPGTSFFSLVDSRGCTVARLPVTPEEERRIRRRLSRKP